jgi:hypothetical protein
MWICLTVMVGMVAVTMPALAFGFRWIELQRERATHDTRLVEIERKLEMLERRLPPKF